MIGSRKRRQEISRKKDALPTPASAADGHFPDIMPFTRKKKKKHIFFGKAFSVNAGSFGRFFFRERGEEEEEEAVIVTHSRVAEEKEKHSTEEEEEEEEEASFSSVCSRYPRRGENTGNFPSFLHRGPLHK